jgi:hypothetical protein
MYHVMLPKLRVSTDRAQSLEKSICSGSILGRTVRCGRVFASGKLLTLDPVGERWCAILLAASAGMGASDTARVSYLPLVSIPLWANWLRAKS